MADGRATDAVAAAAAAAAGVNKPPMTNGEYQPAYRARERSNDVLFPVSSVTVRLGMDSLTIAPLRSPWAGRGRATPPACSYSVAWDLDCTRTPCTQDTDAVVTVMRYRAWLQRMRHDLVTTVQA